MKFTKQTENLASLTHDRGKVSYLKRTWETSQNFTQFLQCITVTVKETRFDLESQTEIWQQHKLRFYTENVFPIFRSRNRGMAGIFKGENDWKLSLNSRQTCTLLCLTVMLAEI